MGEVRFFRGPGRREIGHGALAEKALLPLLPPEDDFPYTIRVVVDILESNGSSSMAAVCSGTLAMLDSGVKLTSPAAGVALGLVMENGQPVVLTDIAGEEDHYGDLDLKIAGTAEGITALQMDVKTTALPLEVIRTAFAQSKTGRRHILETMLKTISEPRDPLSPYAPRISLIQIPPGKIGELIGPGGRNIRKIQETAEVEIEVEDDGSVQVISSSDEARDKALGFIKALTEEPAVGQIFKQVRVSRILSFGAMVEIAPGKEGLVHVSALDHNYVNRVEDVVKVGDLIDVKVVEIDDQKRANLSRKALLPPPPPGTVTDQRRNAPPRQSSGRPQPKLTHRDNRSKGPGKDRRR